MFRWLKQVQSFCQSVSPCIKTVSLSGGFTEMTTVSFIWCNTNTYTCMQHCVTPIMLFMILVQSRIHNLYHKLAIYWLLLICAKNWTKLLTCRKESWHKLLLPCECFKITICVKIVLILTYFNYFVQDPVNSVLVFKAAGLYCPVFTLHCVFIVYW